MKRETKLAKKIYSFLRARNYPRFLHQFGPKTYGLAQHVFGLLVKEVCQMSFRRVSSLLSMLGFDVPSYSALCKRRKKIPVKLWQDLLNITAGVCSGDIAVDSTGLSSSNPSFHYIKRIDSPRPVKRFTKVSVAFDTKNKKFCSVRIRTKPRHDIMDVKYLLKRVKQLNTFYGDTAYDAEWLHEYCFVRSCQTYIKPRVNVKRGRFRKKQMKNYSEEEYHQRNLVESSMRFKSKYGGSVRAKLPRNIQVEVYLRLIASNLGLCPKRLSTKPNKLGNYLLYFLPNQNLFS